MALAKVSEGEQQMVVYLMQAMVVGIGVWNGWNAFRTHEGKQPAPDPRKLTRPDTWALI